MPKDYLADHNLVAVYFEKKRWRSDDIYTIWTVNLFGMPVSVLSTDGAWLDCPRDKLNDYSDGRRPYGAAVASYRRKPEALKAAKAAANAARLGCDTRTREKPALYGPVQICGICGDKDGPWSRSLERFICPKCERVVALGQAATQEASPYAVGRHVGTNMYRINQGLDVAQPLPTRLAAMVGCSLYRHTDRGSVVGAVGHRVDEHIGFDFCVDLTPAQAEAWSALAQWIHDRLEQSVSDARNEGTQLLARLAAGDLTPEDFTPKIEELRKGRSVR